jgi:hypothetical protein
VRPGVRRRHHLPSTARTLQRLKARRCSQRHTAMSALSTW